MTEIKQIRTRNQHKSTGGKSVKWWLSFICFLPFLAHWDTWVETILKTFSTKCSLRDNDSMTTDCNRSWWTDVMTSSNVMAFWLHVNRDGVSSSTESGLAAALEAEPHWEEATSLMKVKVKSERGRAAVQKNLRLSELTSAVIPQQPTQIAVSTADRRLIVCLWISSFLTATPEQTWLGGVSAFTGFLWILNPK